MMTDKVLNHSMTVLSNVCICPLRKKSAPPVHEETVKYTKLGTVANLQRTPTEISKYSAIAKVRILVDK